MIRSWPSVLIGLFVPAFALLAGILLLSGSAASVLGIPALFFWVFCCCPLTTLCLWISWRFFDRAHYPEDD